MKLACPCGCTIRDNTDDLPYKARVTPDRRWEKLWCAFEAALNATPPHSEEQEIELAAKFSHPANFRLAYQCPECARIFIEDRNDRLVEFVPASARRAKGIFRER